MTDASELTRRIADKADAILFDRKKQYANTRKQLMPLLELLKKSLSEWPRLGYCINLHEPEWPNDEICIVIDRGASHFHVYAYDHGSLLRVMCPGQIESLYYGNVESVLSSLVNDIFAPAVARLGFQKESSQ